MHISAARKRGLFLYLSNAIIYTLFILIFRNVAYYQNFLFQQTQQTLLTLYVFYLLVAPFYYLFHVKEDEENKAFLFLQLLGKLVTTSPKNLHVEKKEKVSLLFLLVKFYYVPLMLNFLHGNGRDLFNILNAFEWYPFLLIALFTIDTAIFAFGYVVESRKLQNSVRSVEPTTLGWAVTLVCYPPFNAFVGQYVPWGSNDYAVFQNETATLILRTGVIALLLIYVLASVALGTKASNLTNRGIVTRFPYSIVRHPAYVSKVTMWWITLLPVINIPFALGMLFWTFIYYLRAITEERHLSQDPSYEEYKKKVSYKFIPRII